MTSSVSLHFLSCACFAFYILWRLMGMFSIHTLLPWCTNRAARCSPLMHVASLRCACWACPTFQALPLHKDTQQTPALQQAASGAPGRLRASRLQPLQRLRRASNKVRGCGRTARLLTCAAYRPRSSWSQSGISGRLASTHRRFSSLSACAPVLRVAQAGVKAGLKAGLSRRYTAPPSGGHGPAAGWRWFRGRTAAADKR